MVQTNNSEVIKEIQSATKIQTMQGIPTIVANQIVPTLEVNPKIVKTLECRNGSSTATGNVTVMTLPSNQDFYLYGVMYGYIKNATCDIATGTLNLNVVMNGATRSVVTFPMLTTTAQEDSIFAYFPKGLKLDRGTTITTNATFAAGNLIRSFTLFYGIDETSNA